MESIGMHVEERGARFSGGSLSLLALWLAATMGLWFFAFYAVPVEAPNWVRRAQVACFGSDDSGLPGPAGWMLLILSPLMFLGAILLALGDEAREALRRLWASAAGRAALFLVAAAVLGESVWVAHSISQRIGLSQGADLSADPLLLPASYPRSQQPAPNFELINQFGEKQSLQSAHGAPVLLSFVFAHCQAVCPALVSTITDTMSELGPTRVHAMLITLDPWRDTPAALPGLAKKWKLGPGVSVLSGEPAQVTAVLDAYQVPRERDQKTGDVVHPALVHVIGPAGELAYSFNNPSVAWLKEALARVSQ